MCSYDRNVRRVYNNPNISEVAEAKRLLSWVVCAKRPLKWPEVQGAISIDLEKEIVDIGQHKLRVGPKELCGSLVTVYEDGTIELVHSTAKM